MSIVAVVLSGCGYLDGAEIREAIITLLALDKAGITTKIYAPDIKQMHVVNHLTGDEMDESRNVLIESARIARGNIEPLSALSIDTVDAVILPGGFGAAKNLSDIAVKGKNGTVIPLLKEILTQCLKAKKPIGAICISPALLVAALHDSITPTVTIGDDEEGLITALGGKHTVCSTNDITVDTHNKIVSCSAYMREDSLASVAEGIERLVKQIALMIEGRK